MTDKKKIKEAQKKVKKMDKQRLDIQESLAKISSFVEKYGVHIVTIIVATAVCWYIVAKIPEAFEMWNDDASSVNNLYIYGLVGCTAIIWLFFVLSSFFKIFNKARKG